ncbi:dihydroxyacetone kinase subunit DhaL [Aquipuribacter nitratireducens]|uniref:Dihydroxyacetone kinase subunit DhaL n=1 Tax=Aquipuribacter nitratireducens TaxID=650104 RepID=A0ABW0GLX5_9MICO
MADADQASLAALTDWLRRFAAAVARDERHLTDLDAKIGDADHGSNLRRGTAAVVEALDADPPGDVGAAFKQAGMTLVKTVGGASGPLYGTFMLRFGTTAGAVDALDATALGTALRAGYDGVVARGKAEPGDKTMVDVLEPCLTVFDEAVAGGAGAAAAARAAADAAPERRDATAPLLARKGRASYLGERSVGHVDPGSASTTLLLESLADALAGP